MLWVGIEDESGEGLSMKRQATSADLVAAVRRGVESGTIKGTVEVVGEPGYGFGVDYVAPGTYLVIPVDGEESR